METKNKKTNVFFRLYSIIVLLALSQMTYAQFQGGGMDGRRMPEGGGPNPEMKAINFEESAGIIHFNVTEAIKQSKIKDDNVKTKVEAAFQCYEDSLERISFTHFKDIETLRQGSQSFKEMTNKKDMSKMRETMLGIQESIFTLRPVCVKYQEILQKSLKDGLDEKEWKRMSKYLENIKKEKMPNIPQRKINRQ